MMIEENALKAFRGVLERYEGEITLEGGNRLTIASKNEINGFEVMCEVSVYPSDATSRFKYHVDAHESTLRLLGGVGLPAADEEEAKRMLEDQLKRYGFKERAQMSLFDFAEEGI